MPHTIFISFHPDDEVHAVLWHTKMTAEGFHVILSTSLSDRNNTEHAIKGCTALIALISPSSVTSESVMRDTNLAAFHHKQMFLIQLRNVTDLPNHLPPIGMIDAANDLNAALDHVLAALPQTERGMTLGEAKDIYLQRATLKSQHTLDAYRRAIEQFFEFLADRSGKHLLPVQRQRFVIAEEIPVASLSADDAPILLHFAQWLLSPGSGRAGDRRPYKDTTVELRVSGVQNWLQYLDDYGWLPSDFPLSKAKRIVRDELRLKSGTFSAPRPPDHIGEVIYFYDHQRPPKHLQKPDIDPERIRRWELTRLRNRALLHSLAETGGRISEILSLNLGDFPVRYLHENEVLRVEVTGKGGHQYYLRFFDALPALRAYIEKRGPDLKAASSGKVPLFVSHDPRYDGNRMSRVVAWRVVQRAARALGLGNITPHDFRHWRATQLINAGQSLDVVQEYLGHRSVETTRAYYAHTDPLRVDDAAKNTPLPDPDGEV